MNCNKCKEESCTCIDNGCKPVDASCVIYNLGQTETDLTCIANIAAGTSLKVILETYDSFFCEFANISLLNCVKEKLGFPADTDTTSHTVLLAAIQNYICNLQDIKVKTSASDATNSYLFDKIYVDPDSCLIKSIIEDGNGVQQLKISIDFACLNTKIPACFEIQANECINVEFGDTPCIPLPFVPYVSRVGLQLTGEGCNGVLQWYNANNQLVGTGTTIAVAGNTSYYAKCSTSCGTSANSNTIVVPNIIKYTTTRTANFTRNNCGVNTCNTPCSGSSASFTKIYESTTSQEEANSKAENDINFATEGQNNINTTGTCVCSDCNCVFPTYNSNVLVTNSSCAGNIISATGQIFIIGITNANKFGYSVGAGDYSGVNYSSALALTSFNQGNLELTNNSIKLKALSTETRITFRLFNNANNCYKDVVVNLTPPDCTQEQVEIIDTTVSCEIVETVCKKWTVNAGGTGADVWVANCNTGVQSYQSVLANQSVSVCSKLEPTVTGGVVTENGICQ